MNDFPEILTRAIANGTWKTPDWEALRVLLKSDLPEMELFKDETTMKHVSKQLEASGYVDDPEFCFVRESELSSINTDPRLVFERALFVGGSKVPGDDVFVAVSLKQHGALEVFVFDWSQRIPNRWVARGWLEDLIKGLEHFRV